MIRIHLPSLTTLVYHKVAYWVRCFLTYTLYIVDIVDNISCNSLQYADDTTLYQHCKLKNLQNCIEKLESDLQTMSDWALQKSLVYNDDKMKYLLFS